MVFAVGVVYKLDNIHDRNLRDLQAMRFKRTITALLIACLLLFSFERARALIWQCVVGIVVVTTGVIIAIKIKKFCDEKIPKADAPEPPYCPTNAPSVSKFTLAASGSSLPVIEIDGSNVPVYDVSTNQFQNLDPNGNNYTRFLETSVQCSAVPQGPWRTAFSVRAWISQAYVLTVFYSNGVPVITNGSTMTGGSSTNKVNLPIGANEHTMFFRGSSPL